MTNFWSGVCVGLLVWTFFSIVARQACPPDVVVDAQVRAERARPVFEEHKFDPAVAQRPDCGERQYVAERGANQEWSTVCVDFRRE